MITAATDGTFRIVESDEPDWDAYVRRHPKGSIFHTTMMIRVFEASNGFDPYARAAVDADGNIVAMLVSCHVKTLNRFAAVSSRAIQFGEPLCDPTPTGVAALTEMIKAHDRFMSSRALLCEVRSICQPDAEKEALTNCQYEHLDYINYIIELPDDIDALWKKLNKRMRQKIRSTRRKGVEVRDDRSPEGVQRLYHMLQASYARARVPLPKRDFFCNAFSLLPDDCVRIRTAWKDGKPAASIISLAYEDRVFSWYGGTRRLKGLSPFACIVWDDIVWASKNGYGIYDFGGAGWPNGHYGPRAFKASFAAKEVRFGRYVLPYSKMRLRLAKVVYSISRHIGAWS